MKRPVIPGAPAPHPWNGPFLLAPILLAALSAGCAHLPKVTRVSKGDPKLANVIYYALPRTVVTVHATVRREEVEAGRCSGDSAWLAWRLGSKALPKKDGFRFEIRDWKISSRAEPDPDAVFAIAVSADMFSDGNQAIELSKQGLLVLDSAERAAVIPEFASSAFELGGSALAKAISVSGLAAPADAKTNVDHFCKEAKKRIEDLDSAEFKLVGEAIGDPGKRANLELLLKEVRTTRDQLLLHFTGRVIEKNDYGVQCEFTPATLPSTGDATDQVFTIFGFDPKGGLAPVPGVRCGFPAEVTSDLGSGTPIRAHVRPAAGFATVVRDSAMPADQTKSPSLYYRPASSATISIEDGSAVEVSSVETIAQLGPILWLPGDGDISALRAKYEIALHPETGALKSVAMTTSGAGPKAPASTGDIAGSADAVKAQQSGQTVPEDPTKAKLEEVERERMILEEQRAIDRLKSGQSGP